MKKAPKRLLIPEAFSTLVLRNIKSMETNLQEIWKDIAGYEGFYQVSNLSRVKSLKRYNAIERIKKPQNRNGYHAVKLFNCIDNAGVYYSVHRLVAIAFIPNPENKPCINHKNGIRNDNRLENLEWCTYSENTIHCVQTGLRKTAVGATYKRSKLTDDDILVIRSLEGQLKHREIAGMFGIGTSTATMIINRKYWKHVE